MGAGSPYALTVARSRFAASRSRAPRCTCLASALAGCSAGGLIARYTASLTLTRAGVTGVVHACIDVVAGLAVVSLIAYAGGGTVCSRLLWAATRLTKGVYGLVTLAMFFVGQTKIQVEFIAL